MSGVMIDPKYIYLIETVGSLKTTCTVIAIIAAIGAGVSLITLYATYENASATIEQIKGVADYVIDAISKLK